MALGGSTAGVARVILEADNRRLRAGLAQSERDVRGFASRGSSALGAFARTFAGFGAIGGVAGLGVVLKSSINAASDLNEEIARSEQVFGSAAASVRRWSEGASESLKISQQEALNFNSAIGSMFKTIGIGGPELEEMSRTMVQLGADMASFNNQDPSAMLQRLRSGLAGEAEPLRQFGVFLSEAAVKAQAYKDGIAEVGATLTEAEKVQARYNLILESTRDQQGDVARTGGEVAGQQRELAARVKDLQAALGTALLPVMASVLEQLNEWATSLSENKELQRDVIDAVGGFVDVAGNAIDIIDRIADALGGWEDAAQFIMAGAMLRSVMKLTGGFTALAGAQTAAGGTGILGAAGAAKLLHLRLLALPTSIVIGVRLIAKGSTLDKALLGGEGKTTPELIWEWWQRSLGGGGGGGGSASPIVKPPGGLAFPGGRTPTGAIQLPTQQKTTHQTSGLGGFPAQDWFGKPGTAILAPENGRIVRHSGSGGTSGQVYGWSLYFDGAQTGNLYYITHLAWRAPLGAYKRGDVIGTISAWSGGAPHAHVGIKYGGGKSFTPVIPREPSRPSAAAVPVAAQQSLEEQLARARLTKGTADDLRVLRLIETDLERTVKREKDAAKRISALNELRQTREEIADLLAGPKTRKPRVSRRGAGLTEFVPLNLRIALETAEATKPYDDDITILEKIIKELERLLGRSKKGTDRYLAILRDLNSFRADREAAVAALASRATKPARSAEQIIGGRPERGRPATMFAPGTDIVSQITTKEGAEDWGKWLASVEPYKADIRSYGTKAYNAREHVRGILKTLRAQRRKLQASRFVPGKAAALARNKAEIDRRLEEEKALTEAVDWAFEAWGEIEAEEMSEAARIAGEDEQRRSEPPPSGGGASAGGGDVGAGDGLGASQQFIQDQIAAANQTRYGFFKELSPHIFTPGVEGLLLGTGPLGTAAGGGNTVTVNQFITQPDPDPHALLKEAQFASEAVFG